jgi:hypothetical protein
LQKHRVDTLPLESALELFRKGWSRPEPISEAIEKLVVSSCGGLPLALLMVKGALRDCTVELEWTVRALQLILCSEAIGRIAPAC